MEVGIEGAKVSGWLGNAAAAWISMLGSARPSSGRYAMCCAACHRAGVINLDLFSANVLWRRYGRGSAGDGIDKVELCLDFDVSLECRQAVPEMAQKIVHRNGHLHSYDPELFCGGAGGAPPSTGGTSSCLRMSLPSARAEPQRQQSSPPGCTAKAASPKCASLWA